MAETAEPEAVVTSLQPPLSREEAFALVIASVRNFKRREAYVAEGRDMLQARATVEVDIEDILTRANLL